jgi:hypothetical protein
MARSRKKSLSQQVVGVATVGMPSPAKKVLTSRIGALLIVLAVPILLATGIVTVQWENGRPKVSVNRERAAEVRQEAAERIEDFRDEHDHERPAIADYVPQLGERESQPTGFTADLQRDVEGFEHRVTQRFDEARHNLVGDDNRGWNIGSVGQPVEPSKQAFQPFQNVREKIEDLRR